MQFPDVNAMVFSMLYFEGETFTECNLGQSLKQTNKKSEMESDKELAVIQEWICVGRPKLCFASYRKEQNNKAWPPPTQAEGYPLLAPVLLQP